MSSIKKKPRYLSLASVGIFYLFTNWQAFADSKRYFIQVASQDKFDRTQLVDLGFSIEFVRSDSVWGFADEETLQEIKEIKRNVLGVFPEEVGRGGQHGTLDYPSDYRNFHNYDRLIARLKSFVQANPDLTQMISIGKSVEGRDIWALQINSSLKDRRQVSSGKPGVVFMGAHHAREHLSKETPILLIDYLLKNRNHPEIKRLIESRDIWIIPAVNPDGIEWDISSGSFKMWRKNRSKNTDGTAGVDLNRNYGYKWGTGGSSTRGANETYMGPVPFSEPETQAIKTFIENRPNLKVLLSLHTYSELILYPWGHKYDDLEIQKDRATFETMARTMAKWNGYKPQQSSDLYIASGDTTDWAYGALGIFAFTFELSPKDMWGGGFYPGASLLAKVFQDNLRPFLYLIDVADNPYKVLDHNPNFTLSGFETPEGYLH